MATNSFPEVRTHIAELLRTAVASVAPGVDIAVNIERSKQAQHGDYACSVALQLAKQLKRNPREIAGALIAALPVSPHISKVEIAGAGFINLFLNPDTKRAVLSQIIATAENYGRSSYGAGKEILLEFVSANPTGPLHVGHGRGAALGASLANILDAAGFNVACEYYVNDAGRQMDILALSTWLRYLELGGIHVPFPENAYQGDYVRTMAQQLLDQVGDRFRRDTTAVVAGAPPAEQDGEGHLDQLIANAKRLLGEDYALLHKHVLREQLADCRDDLAEFGVHYDDWYSEQSLYDTGKIDRTLAELRQKGHLYEKDGAIWFKATDFGDEKDRVVRRENGQYTYFASDIAYHRDKIERGFDSMIDVWGADHHGYIPRVKGALSALGLRPEQLIVALVQFAVLYRNGEKLPMSTRKGQYVTLRDLRREVGNDAARFFYVLRKSDQHLDFDLDLAKSQSNDNPVYYVQYAHARVCSVWEQWKGNTEEFINAYSDDDLSALTQDAEMALMLKLIQYPEVVENAATELAPHLVAFYLRELAAEFHSYYNSTRILAPEEALAWARLVLITAVRQVLHNGLTLLGVAAPEKM